MIEGNVEVLAPVQGVPEGKSSLQPADGLQVTVDAKGGVLLALDLSTGLEVQEVSIMVEGQGVHLHVLDGALELELTTDGGGHGKVSI